MIINVIFVRNIRPLRIVALWNGGYGRGLTSLEIDLIKQLLYFDGDWSQNPSIFDISSQLCQGTLDEDTKKSKMDLLSTAVVYPVPVPVRHDSLNKS